MADQLGAGPHLDYHAFLEAVTAQAKEMAVKLTAKNKKFLRSDLALVDEAAEPVIRKIHKAIHKAGKGSKVKADPLHGLYERTVKGKKVVVEYEPDTNLRDSEQVPLLEEGGIAAFIEREVLPYTPGAWVDGLKTQIGYEISFTRHFYKPVPMRTLDQIKRISLPLKRKPKGCLKRLSGRRSDEGLSDV
ncbi:type I restriction enzyme M protein [Candidatus Electrothrix aarhusensis]|uniref:Type I restriction enzyme M protein n=1 Tax=Candidatus Electrothrix aarhusensis TaxID=1859131 RepID=A0A3S3UAA7_9BACT|nr:type I restriction enzyme M protein [Candidatus Electrothrix aarhusensis]